MEIDYQRQSKYSPDEFQPFIEIEEKFIRETSFNEIENVIKDISFVRYQSTNFTFLYAGQFDFERTLTLPYWDFLFIRGQINEDVLLDIQEGCLLILALFFIEIYDDNGSSYIYSNQLFKQLDIALNYFKPNTNRQKIVVDKIKYLRKYSEDEKVLRRLEPDENSIEIEKEIENCNKFIYQELIESYYWDKAKSFEVSRQQSADEMKFVMANQKPI